MIIVLTVFLQLPPETITLNPSTIGTIDEASKEVIAAEKEQEKLEQEAKKIKRRKKKMRGRSKASKETRVKESVYDEKTRNKIKAKIDSRIRVRRAEKEKVKRDLSILEHLDEIVDTAALSKKIKK